MRFSIVVPVYNAEKYLKATLDSIFTQTFVDYEVIIINDGSTDNSLTIAKKYADEYGCKVIDKHNNGCYAARVEGIIKSCGEYIINVDSDDIFANNMVLEKLDNNLKKLNNPDILIYGYNEMSEKGEIVKTKLRNNWLFNKKSDLNNFYKQFLSTTQYNSIWSKVFKKELFSVDQIINKKINMCDDVFISLNIIENAAVIASVEDAFYNYRINPTSLVRQYEKSDLVNILVYEKMSSFLIKLKLGEEFSKIIAERLLKDCAVTYLLAPNNVKNKSKCYKKDLMEISECNTYKNVCKDYLNKQSFCIRFINRLILKKRIKTIMLFKHIIQIKSINNLMRRLYGKT